MKTLGSRLKSWRESEQLSINDLATVTTVNEDDLYLIETDRVLPTWDILNKLRIYTEMDFRWFLLGTTEPVSYDFAYD